MCCCCGLNIIYNYMTTKFALANNICDILSNKVCIHPISYTCYCFVIYLL